MKISNIIISTCLIIFGFCMGFIWYDHAKVLLGGVRGGARTGFHLMSGENIAIGTSTPILANIHIYETSTTSVAIDGTIVGCLRLLDTDGGGYTNITALNGTIGTSTDATCGF